ncbi:PREDICTED: putative nuclease HARBI1 [Trachymyrmex cornetzi]|uniref:putative nuclease HARBI1 n=1 Tax=Trachymyrmex cornetzi TaxID=471704 RepID=UPI00084F59A2|nr:PREDICTED: putative nuclease HARBI1 [Trachymyrmex cornetzi]
MSSFFKFTRCSPSQFNELLQLVGHKLQKDTRRNPYILSPSHRLILTLHYLAEGCTMQEIARNFRIGKTTAHVIIKETCKILWDVLQPRVLKRPSIDDWKNIAHEFYHRWNMPYCFGAVDGKHINIMAPKHFGTEVFNYKKSFSIVLMAVCDAYYRFTFVDIGAAGSNHDSVIFKESAFVADQAFPLDKHIMRPYPGNNLGEKKNIFNYRLSRARRTIENAFGILVQQWRILRKEIIASVETCEEIVMATIILHNFLQRGAEDIPQHERRYVVTGVSEYIDENGVLLHKDIPCDLRSIGRLGSNNPSKTVKEARDELADYFVSVEGALPWQWEYVRQGNVP